MIEIGYKYLHRVNNEYNNDMILEKKDDLKQFNNLFNAGFELSDDANDDIFIDTDDNKENGENKSNKNKTIHEDHNVDPFNDSE